ncbi:hypothetical protein C2W64_02058 [Brevibacillus laterosporus]|nr:hypothetical protein C2W64_02058 [Brevibacillus laterosporus]
MIEQLRTLTYPGFIALQAKREERKYLFSDLRLCYYTFRTGR